METKTELKKKDAANWLDVSTRTIDRLRADGELEASRVRGGVRIEIASLQAYKDRQRKLAREKQQRQDGGGSIVELFPIAGVDDLRAQKAAARISQRADELEAA